LLLASEFLIVIAFIFVTKRGSHRSCTLSQFTTSTILPDSRKPRAGVQTPDPWRD